MDLSTATTVQVLRAIDGGEVSSTEVLEAQIANYERMNPSVNAVATLIVLVVSVGVVLASLAIARAERKRAQDMAAAARGS